MRAPFFRGPTVTVFLTWRAIIAGIIFIACIGWAIGAEIVKEWPDWGCIICVVLAAGVVFLSWLWFKMVRRAAEDGEFDL